MPAELAPSALFDLERLPWRGLFADLGAPWEALGARLAAVFAEELAGGRRIEGRVEDGAVLVGEAIRIGGGTVVEAGATIHAPCVIGRDVEVRQGAYLRGQVLVGDGAVIGHATEAKASIFLPGAKAGHFAYVGDSILGCDVNLGAGTKLANLRFDGSEVCVRCGESLVPTGRRKLGAILGDGAQTGCNSVTNPGTVLGRGCLVPPCVAVGGYHAPGTTCR